MATRPESFDRQKQMTPVKQSVHDLALFGGQPLFPDPVHVGEPAIGDRQQFLTRINDVLDRRRLTNNGPLVKELERRLERLLGVRNCVLVSNATAGLMIALRAISVEGHVIVPAFTFVGTVHAIQWAGLRPLLCEVDPQTHNLNPDAVANLITADTAAILGVHLWGRPCAITELTALADRHRLKLLFDAAHAFYCRHNGKFIGSFGHAEVVSFHATKWFNTLEGGAVLTNDDELAGQARLMRNFGFAGEDNVVSTGINAKMNEISAAMGLAQLDVLPKSYATYSRNYRRYEACLSAIHGVRMARLDPDANHCRYIVIELNEDAAINRDILYHLLQSENVLARRYFYPGCQQIEPYKSALEAEGRRLPETDMLVRRTLCLPNNLTLTIADIEKICGLIHFSMENAPEVRKLVDTTIPAHHGRQSV